MRIIHIFRSPVGGLFRHVADLVRGQHAIGHSVGIICDSLTGGENASAALAQLQPLCALGVTRLPISTAPGPGDVKGLRNVTEIVQRAKPDVLHGHGAKGGVFARLAARKEKLRAAYTPHGGSLHYNWLHFPGVAYLSAERALRDTGAGLIFVCEFERQLYDRKIGLGRAKSTVIYNGLWPEEFYNRQPDADATDLLFVGEMRHLKGVDVLLHAATRLNLTLTLIGEGGEQAKFEALAGNLGLSLRAKFLGRKPMHEALKLGKVLVMPSRHESFPYVVLESVAACVPVIASSVGGIPEMLPPDVLVPPDNPGALAEKLEKATSNPVVYAKYATELQKIAEDRFSAKTMARWVLDFYGTLR